ncbi:copper-binding protein [Erythrobacter arachoides]|uniref:Copper-binding protein n=1 Tax=Aurantiacibacter arachoides TaxID=1850444 RepID=A0A844ZZW5_9SPHN|nr:cupredoxin domain-containing protein [Aurantiacibacter arachoides]MXO92800.1 copper-binding protein [Aurantiacibacter arachoides]GGD54366.1 hypothetical protein GCM10011411_12890 [Aurantiacibacter arachoides]
MTFRLALTAIALALSACAIPTTLTPQIAPADTSFASAQRIEVTLSNFAFDPQTISLRAGQPVVLVLTNTTGRAHNFAAPDFFAATQIAQSDAAVIADGQVEVAPGGSVELRLVPRAGAYDLECTHVGHSIRGMIGSIVVR